MLPGVSLEVRHSSTAAQRPARHRTRICTRICCFRISAPGSDVCEAHLSLILFPESLIDAVVNNPAAADELGCLTQFHTEPPPGSTYMSRLLSNRKASLTHTSFTYILLPHSFLFLWLCVLRQVHRQLISSLSCTPPSPTHRIPARFLQSPGSTTQPGLGLIRPDLTCSGGSSCGALAPRTERRLLSIHFSPHFAYLYK